IGRAVIAAGAGNAVLTGIGHESCFQLEDHLGAVAQVLCSLETEPVRHGYAAREFLLRQARTASDALDTAGYAQPAVTATDHEAVVDRSVERHVGIRKGWRGSQSGDRQSNHCLVHRFSSR